jgi:hypothetical protein
VFNLQRDLTGGFGQAHFLLALELHQLFQAEFAALQDHLIHQTAQTPNHPSGLQQVAGQQLLRPQHILQLHFQCRTTVVAVWWSYPSYPQQQQQSRSAQDLVLHALFLVQMVLWFAWGFLHQLQTTIPAVHDHASPPEADSIPGSSY